MTNYDIPDCGEDYQDISSPDASTLPSRLASFQEVQQLAKELFKEVQEVAKEVQENLRLQ